MKKGATHVDWAISMGIFLVYVLLMFIFLKPATEPTYSETSLLDIVHSGLKNDTTFTIQKKYLTITPQGDEFNQGKEYRLRIRDPDKSGLEDTWIASDVSNHLTLVNESLGKVSCHDMPAVPFDFTDEQNPNRVQKVLEIKAPLETGSNTFWFLYSEETEYFPHHGNVVIDLTDEDCVERTGPDDDRVHSSDCMLDDKDTPVDWDDDHLLNFTYKFGVTETFTAFSEEKLKTLNQTYYNQYEALKANWSFPTDKNFNITIEKLS